MCNVATISDFIGEKVTVLELMRGFGVVEKRKIFANVVDMLFGCLSEDHDAVQINKCKLSFDARKDHVNSKSNWLGSFRKVKGMQRKRY